jgi:hypothetical protein
VYKCCGTVSTCDSNFNLIFPCNYVSDLQFPNLTIIPTSKIYLLHVNIGARGSVVVKTLCYKLEGHRFETR